MTKITEEQRAELLASNASRDVVEAVLARLDAAERMLVEAMEPRGWAVYADDSGEDCPFCGGENRDMPEGGRGYQHTADCEWVAWGTGLYEWRPMHGPQPRTTSSQFSAAERDSFAAAMRGFEEQLVMSMLASPTMWRPTPYLPQPFSTNVLPDEPVLCDLPDGSCLLRRGHDGPCRRTEP
jgi:hypothetical protein